MLLLPLASFLSSAPSPLSLCSFGDGWSLIDFYLSFVVYLFIYLSCMLVCVGARCLVACCERCLYGCVLSLRVVCVSCACVRRCLVACVWGTSVLPPERIFGYFLVCPLADVGRGDGRTGFRVGVITYRIVACMDRHMCMGGIGPV